jgi:Arc/MetJ family transcription regulator
MRITVVVDSDVLAGAMRLSGIGGKSAVVNAALTALIQRESAHALALLGGAAPKMRQIPRRRSNPAVNDRSAR